MKYLWENTSAWLSPFWASRSRLIDSIFFLSSKEMNIYLVGYNEVKVFDESSFLVIASRPKRLQDKHLLFYGWLLSIQTLLARALTSALLVCFVAWTVASHAPWPQAAALCSGIHDELRSFLEDCNLSLYLHDWGRKLMWMFILLFKEMRFFYYHTVDWLLVLDLTWLSNKRIE